MALSLDSFDVSQKPLNKRLIDETNNYTDIPIDRDPTLNRFAQGGVYFYRFTVISTEDIFIDFNSIFFAFSGNTPMPLMAPLSRSNGFLIDIISGNTNLREMSYFGSDLKRNYRAFFQWQDTKTAFINFYFLQNGNEDEWDSGFNSFSDSVKKQAYYGSEMFQAAENPYEGANIRIGNHWVHFSIYNNFSPFAVPIETLTTSLYTEFIKVDFFGRRDTENDYAVIDSLKIFEINNSSSTAEKIGEQERVLKPIPSPLHSENYRYIGSTNGINPFTQQVVRIEVDAANPLSNGCTVIIYNEKDFNNASSLSALQYESQYGTLDGSLVDDPLSYEITYPFSPSDPNKIQEVFFNGASNILYFWLDGRKLTRGERYRIGIISDSGAELIDKNLVDVSLPMPANISPRIVTHCTPYMGNYDLELGTVRCSAAKHDEVYSRMVINKTQFEAIIRGYGFSQTFDNSSVFISMDAMDSNYQGNDPEFEGALYNLGNYNNSNVIKKIDTPTFKISNQEQTLEILGVRRIDENYPLDNSIALNNNRFYFVRFRLSWVLDGQQINQFHFFELRAHEFRKGTPSFGSTSTLPDSLTAISFFQGDTYPSVKVPLRIQCRDRTPILNPISEVESRNVPAALVGDTFTYAAAIYAGQQTPLPITDTLLEEHGSLKRGYLEKRDYTYFNSLTNPLNVTGFGTHRVTLQSFFANAWETVIKRKVGKFYHLLTGGNQEIPVKIKIGEYRATGNELFFDVAPELEVFLGNFFTSTLLMEQGVMIDLITNTYNAFGSGLSYSFPIVPDNPYYWMASYDCDGVYVYILVGILPSLTDYDIFIEPRMIQYFVGDCLAL